MDLMTFQAQTSQQEGEFGSQESILIDGGVKPDPPELFERSPLGSSEWLKFFLISMFCSPGLVEKNKFLKVLLRYPYPGSFT